MTRDIYTESSNPFDGIMLDLRDIEDPFNFITEAVYENKLIEANINLCILSEEYSYLRANGGQELTLVQESNIIGTIFTAIKNAIKTAFKKICEFFKSIFSKQSEHVEKMEKKADSVDAKAKKAGDIEILTAKGGKSTATGKTSGAKTYGMGDDTVKKMAGPNPKDNIDMYNFSYYEYPDIDKLVTEMTDCCADIRKTFAKDEDGLYSDFIKLSYAKKNGNANAGRMLKTALEEIKQTNKDLQEMVRQLTEDPIEFFASNNNRDRDEMDLLLNKITLEDYAKTNFIKKEFQGHWSYQQTKKTLDDKIENAKKVIQLTKKAFNEISNYIQDYQKWIDECEKKTITILKENNEDNDTIKLLSENAHILSQFATQFNTFSMKVSNTVVKVLNYQIQQYSQAISLLQTAYLLNQDTIYL